jgi:hypothetical protein
MYLGFNLGANLVKKLEVGRVGVCIREGCRTRSTWRYFAGVGSVCCSFKPAEVGGEATNPHMREPISPTMMIEGEGIT